MFLCLSFLMKIDNLVSHIPSLVLPIGHVYLFHHFLPAIVFIQDCFLELDYYFDIGFLNDVFIFNI